MKSHLLTSRSKPVLKMLRGTVRILCGKHTKEARENTAMLSSRFVGLAISASSSFRNEHLAILTAIPNAGTNKNNFADALILQCRPPGTFHNAHLAILTAILTAENLRRRRRRLTRRTPQILTTFARPHMPIYSESGVMLG